MLGPGSAWRIWYGIGVYQTILCKKTPSRVCDTRNFRWHNLQSIFSTSSGTAEVKVGWITDWDFGADLAKSLNLVVSLIGFYQLVMLQKVSDW